MIPIIKAIKKYVAIGMVVLLVAVSGYAGYLKWQNNDQAKDLRSKEAELSTAIDINEGLIETLQRVRDDKEKAEKLLAERDLLNDGLEKIYDETLAKLNAVEQDAAWNRTVLVPCAVTDSLFPEKGLGCRPPVQ